VHESKGECLMLSIKDSTYDNSHPGWKRNEQIVIEYGKNSFKKCKCDECFVAEDAEDNCESEVERMNKMRRVTPD
jgi:hypothetical protein